MVKTGNILAVIMLISVGSQAAMTKYERAVAVYWKELTSIPAMPAQCQYDVPVEGGVADMMLKFENGETYVCEVAKLEDYRAAIGTATMNALATNCDAIVILYYDKTAANEKKFKEIQELATRMAERTGGKFRLGIVTVQVPAAGEKKAAQDATK